jgi:hypothetical protein
MPSEARITEIDISRPARALTVLRWSDFILVIGCGLGALGMAGQSVVAAAGAQWADFFIVSSMAAVLGLAAYTSWRHVGVIDPQVWRSYLWVFPLLAGVSTFFAFALLATRITQGIRPFGSELGFFIAFATYLQFAAVAIPGFVCVLALRRVRVAPVGARLADVIESLNDRGSEPPARSTSVPRINPRRGLAYGIAGVAIVLAAQWAPVSLEGRQATTTVRGLWLVTLAGFFLLIRARRYFQVSADSLLAVDKRPPVLFLRSFADDERQQYGSSQRALLDFSLETRLANHFHRFGPFIAIGSPKETVPQPGAARVRLSDDQWQSQVLDWMKTANVITMYCGTTQWVNWELRQVIEQGGATRLILMFPEMKKWWPSGRRRDIAARTQRIREVFHDTPWTEELTQFSDFAGLRAMLFRADGSMLMIKSRSRSRDAYHLAALIAHQQLLDPESTAESLAARVHAPVRRRGPIIAGVLAGAAAVFSVWYVVASGDGNRLAFERGELLYKDPVTQAEAQRVGEFLAQQQFFNAQNASTAQLLKDKELYQLRFVVNPALVEGVLVNIQFGLLASTIAQTLLDGKPLEVTFNDPNLKPVKVVSPSARVEFGKSEVFYTHPITVDEARLVGQQLFETGYFSVDSRRSVHLGREEGTYQLRFIIDPSRANDGEIVAAFGELTAGIARQALGGKPVVVHLCDGEFRTLNRKRIEQQVGAATR